MTGKPAARLGDATSCPKKGHGDNPIVSGSPDVFFDGLPAARAGDTTACGSVLTGNIIPNVLINGRPAVVQGSLGDHGNLVIGGSGTVIIGTSHTPAPFVPPEPLNLDGAPVARAPAAPELPQRPASPNARAWQQEPGDPAPYGLEEEDEEEELGSRQAVTLRIGVFFDGTGNNAANSAIGAQCRAPALGLGEQEALAMVQRCEAHHLDPDSSYANDVSNIWRLYELYRDEPVPKEAGNPSIFRVYVTGVGTTTGKPDTRFPGQAFGRGATGVLAKVDEGLTLLAQSPGQFRRGKPRLHSGQAGTGSLRFQPRRGGGPAFRQSDPPARAGTIGHIAPRGQARPGIRLRLAGRRRHQLHRPVRYRGRPRRLGRLGRSQR
ncbi:Rhs element Vgr protein [Stutzerimonas stutzeri ATCC 14405 = CCUG 16156]|uniref:PAAR domain-containing protein n=1 Tax=Stutzerimonas stutzeri TaxID=316 RepID=UPI000254927B|nr:PAAR domain-containing protein [Stutzerimonas stutzeri]EHY77618.1 Rhs element Vgr protein [Stutzerimonas stutzeri ATCC 14405 = CCUG 16156]